MKLKQIPFFLFLLVLTACAPVATKESSSPDLFVDLSDRSSIRDTLQKHLEEQYLLFQGLYVYDKDKITKNSKTYVNRMRFLESFRNIGYINVEEIENKSSFIIKVSPVSKKSKVLTINGLKGGFGLHWLRADVLNIYRVKGNSVWFDFKITPLRIAYDRGFNKTSVKKGRAIIFPDKNGKYIVRQFRAYMERNKKWELRSFVGFDNKHEYIINGRKTYDYNVNREDLISSFEEEKENLKDAAFFKRHPGYYPVVIDMFDQIAAAPNFSKFIVDSWGEFRNTKGGTDFQRGVTEEMKGSLAYAIKRVPDEELKRLYQSISQVLKNINHEECTFLFENSANLQGFLYLANRVPADVASEFFTSLISLLEIGFSNSDLPINDNYTLMIQERDDVFSIIKNNKQFNISSLTEEKLDGVDLCYIASEYIDLSINNNSNWALRWLLHQSLNNN
ncbi:MAG: hypothetical protein JXR18_02170 [Neptuniibacter sp.]